MSLVSRYNDVPVSFRTGNANCAYTYKCCKESELEGILKFEIMADSIEMAIAIVECQLGNVMSWTYVSNDVISLSLSMFPNDSCLLWC